MLTQGMVKISLSGASVLPVVENFLTNLGFITQAELLS